jgi:hypothetical protein
VVKAGIFADFSPAYYVIKLIEATWGKSGAPNIFHKEECATPYFLIFLSVETQIGPISDCNFERDGLEITRPTRIFKQIESLVNFNQRHTKIEFRKRCNCSIIPTVNPTKSGLFHDRRILVGLTQLFL